MIKVNSMFKDVKLQKLSDESKLLYIFLITNPEVDVLGVCPLNMDVVTIQLNTSISTLRKSTTSLIESGLVKVFNHEGVVYFLLTKHYSTQPKGTQTLKKATDKLSVLPKIISDYITENFDLEAKSTVFVEPSVEEIEDFANSSGFSVDGNQIREYYRGRAEFFRKKVGWWDGKGKQVIDWKRKVRNVWCKDTNKLKENPDAPDDAKFFYVNIDGRQVYPDYWKGGRPFSRGGIIETTELQEAYGRKRDS